MDSMNHKHKRKPIDEIFPPRNIYAKCPPEFVFIYAGNNKNPIDANYLEGHLLDLFGKKI
jgi:hypothetical protein